MYTGITGLGLIIGGIMWLVTSYKLNQLWHTVSPVSRAETEFADIPSPAIEEAGVTGSDPSSRLTHLRDAHKPDLDLAVTSEIEIAQKVAKPGW